VIPDTWEKEIRKIMVQSLPRQKISDTSSKSINLGAVAYFCHPSYVRDINRGIKFKFGLGSNNARPYPQNN
jgi:hypothetical protein